MWFMIEIIQTIQDYTVADGYSKELLEAYQKKLGTFNREGERDLLVMHMECYYESLSQRNDHNNHNDNEEEVE